MLARLLITTVFLLSACGHRTEPPPQSPAPAPSPTLPSTPVPVSSTPDDPCQGHGSAWVEIPDADAVCQEDDHFWHGSCVTTLDVMVHNCGGMQVQVLGMKLLLDGDVKVEWQYEDVMAQPGETWNREVTLGPQTGQYSMEVHLKVGENAAAWEWVDFTVTNTTMSAAQQACDECNGHWGAHGMLGIVGCLCRTGDAGTPCDDGNDCEGKCISEDGKFQCSEFFSVFGCHSYLPPGWSEETHTGLTKAPYMCVD